MRGLHLLGLLLLSVPAFQLLQTVITIPKTWDVWAKTLIGGMISGGATAALASLSLSGEHAVGVNTAVQSFTLGQMEHQFVAGAVIGALMFLAKSPTPPDAGDTIRFYRQQGLTPPADSTQVNQSTKVDK